MTDNPFGQSEDNIRIQRKSVKTASGPVEMRKFPFAKAALYVTPYLEDFNIPEDYALQKLKQKFENLGFGVEVARSAQLTEDELEELRKKWKKTHGRNGPEFAPPRRVSTLKVSSNTIDVDRDFVRVALNNEHPYAVFTHWNGTEVTVGACVYRKDLVTRGESDVIPFDVMDKYVVTTESSSEFTKLSKRLALKQWQEAVIELGKIRETGTILMQKSMGLEDEDEEELVL